MRVASYYNNKDVRVEEWPIPKIGKGEVLLKTHALGICGSDVMEWYRISKTPRILGHEVAGEIAEVGEGVPFKKGDRIAASHHVPCYDCHYCRLGHHTLCDTIRTTNFDPGGFAEWIRIPAINVKHGIYKLPDPVSFDEATLIEPLACVVRGQRKVQIRKEQTILVIGCGIAGLLHLLLARCQGVRKTIACDISPYRLEAAKKFGADHVLKASEEVPSQIRRLNEDRLADVVVVCSGAESATRLSLTTVGRGGSVLFFAPQAPGQTIPLEMNDLFWERGVTVTSSYAASPADHRESLSLIATKQIPAGRLITHRLGFSEVAKGFEMVAAAGESLKIVIDPIH